MAGVLARAYRRSTLGYVALFVGVLVTVIVGYTGASVWIFARYFGLSTDEFRLFLLCGESGPVVGLMVSAAVSSRKEPGIIDWLGGGGTGDQAIEAWNGLAGLPARLVLRSMLIIGAITAPLLTFAIASAELDLVVLGMLLAGMVILNLGCASFALVLLDIFLRPIRTEIDQALPRDFQPSHLGVDMDRRITGELFLLIFPPAILTAGLLAPEGGGADAFAKSFLVGGLVTGVFAALIGQVIVERMSGPVRDLLRGTRAVTAGDLTVRVPLASTDEHLVLADSFNRMVTGLGERQAFADLNEQLQAEVHRQLEEVRESRARIVTAADEARQKVERDLHDGAQQRLISLALGLRLAEARLGDTVDPVLRETLSNMADDVGSAIEELRELARGLHPRLLEDEGLAAALESLALRSAVPVTLVQVPEGRLPAAVEAAAYFLVAEALSNVAKHAQASHVRVRAAHTDGELFVEVADDGVGGARAHSGSGLRGLQDRVEAFAGTFGVDSSPGSGTTLRARIPCALPARTH